MEYEPIVALFQGLKPEPHKGEKSNPDSHQSADPQHLFWTVSSGRSEAAQEQLAPT